MTPLYSLTPNKYFSNLESRIAELKAENTRLQEQKGLLIIAGEQIAVRLKSTDILIIGLEEQNAQMVFATELLVKELNALKEVKQEECPDITISP